MIGALLAAAVVSSAAWTAPATVPGSATSFPFPTTVAVAADGTAAVAWRHGGDVPTTASVRVAVREPGGAWHARRLSDRHHGTAGPRVAVDDRGRVVVVWVEVGRRPAGRIHGPFLVRVATRDRAGRWGSTQTLGRSTNFAEAFPDVAVDRRGDAVVVWRGRRAHGTLRAVLAASRTHGGRFGPATALHDAGGGLHVGPRVALDAAGGATAVWTTVGDHAQVRVATRPPGGRWSRGTDLGRAPGSAPVVAADAAGDVTVAWRQADIDSEGAGIQSGPVAVAQQPAGGMFGAPAVLGDAPATTPMISAAPGGQTYVAWARTPFDPPGPIEFHVAQAAPGAAFAEQAYPAGAEAVALAALGNGHGLIASVAGGVAVRELTPGAAAPAPDQVSTGGTEPRLAAAGTHAIVVWLRGGRLRYAVRTTGGAR